MKKIIILAIIIIFCPIAVASTVEEVGNEIGENGYNQIFIETKDKKYFITSTESSNTDPHTDGEFVSWVGHTETKTEVYFTHATSQKHLALSGDLNATNPRIDQGKVVWEEYVSEGGWQVFLFDGIRKLQLTSGDESRNPHIEGNYVTLGRKGEVNAWYAEVYNIVTKESVRVAEGIGAKAPSIVDGQIVLRGKGYDEPTGTYVHDILPNPVEDHNKHVSLEDIRQELDAIAQE